MAEGNDLEILGKVEKSFGINQVIPEIYKDIFKPAAKELGKSLELVSKYVRHRIEEKFSDKPENIIPPLPNIAIPLLEYLHYTVFQAELREMYVNLLLTSMDRERTEKAHPSFVEIIKQLSQDEARLLSYIPKLADFPDVCSVKVYSSSAHGEIVYSAVEHKFSSVCKDAKLNFPDLSKSYLDNFRRLLILEFKQEVANQVIDERRREKEIKTDYIEYISVTSFGQNFLAACVEEKKPSKINIDDCFD